LILFAFFLLRVKAVCTKIKLTGTTIANTGMGARAFGKPRYKNTFNNQM